MSVANKVRMATSFKRKNAVQMAAHMGIHAQSYRNKLTRDSFNVWDLIEISEAIGGKLVLEVDDQRIVFGVEDLPPERIEKYQGDTEA